MTDYKLGDIVYQGGAIAVYWPDSHPSGPDKSRDGKPWIVLESYGGVSYTNKLQEPIIVSSNIQEGETNE